MIVWLNGTFGVGKTTTAEALSSRWPQAIVFDPEVLGIGLRRWTPTDALVRDFQDIQLWRDLVVTTCSGLVAEWGRPLIVPMTVLRPSYFDDVIGRLREAGEDVRHFCLTAPAAVLRTRAETRSRTSPEFTNMSAKDRLQALSWIEERWAEHDASDTRFAQHIDTTQGDTEHVAELIAAALPVPLPARLSTARWSSWYQD